MPAFYNASNAEQGARSSLHCLSRRFARISATNPNPTRHNNPQRKFRTDFE